MQNVETIRNAQIDEQEEKTKEKTELIKVLSKTWNSDQWEEYLNTLETPQSELLLGDPDIIQDFSDQEHKDFLNSNFNIETENKAFKNLINKILKSLPKVQRDILHLMYWEDKTLVEAAEIQKITKQSAFKAKNRAFKKISSILLRIASN